METRLHYGRVTDYIILYTYAMYIREVSRRTYYNIILPRPKNKLDRPA